MSSDNDIVDDVTKRVVEFSLSVSAGYADEALKAAMKELEAHISSASFLEKVGLRAGTAQVLVTRGIAKSGVDAYNVSIAFKTGNPDEVTKTISSVVVGFAATKITEILTEKFTNEAKSARDVRLALGSAAVGYVLPPLVGTLASAVHDYWLWDLIPKNWQTKNRFFSLEATVRDIKSDASENVRKLSGQEFAFYREMATNIFNFASDESFRQDVIDGFTQEIRDFIQKSTDKVNSVKVLAHQVGAWLKESSLSSSGLVDSILTGVRKSSTSMPDNVYSIFSETLRAGSGVMAYNHHSTLNSFSLPSNSSVDFALLKKN